MLHHRSAMLNDKTIKNLKRAVDALSKPARSTGAWEALEPLSRLTADGTDVSIDFKASAQIGAPIVIARPRINQTGLLAPLTPRQRQVAELIVAGLPNKQIARELDISVATVKDHVHAILQRIGVRSRAELIAAATR